jgi:hypothetical protein
MLFETLIIAYQSGVPVPDGDAVGLGAAYVGGGDG